MAKKEKETQRKEDYPGQAKKWTDGTFFEPTPLDRLTPEQIERLGQVNVNTNRARRHIERNQTPLFDKDA